MGRETGGNPFLQLTVPEASRKLIQACGRLIRKEADRGRVTILDRRLLTKRYGKGLLDALPPSAVGLSKTRVDWLGQNPCRGSRSL